MDHSPDVAPSGASVLRTGAAGSATPPIFTPFVLGRLRLPNRMVVAPMTRVCAQRDGSPTAHMARYYAAYTRGGFGLLITEGMYTDTRHSRAYGRQPGLAGATHIKGWRLVTDAVHDAGGLIFAQLMHAGALSQTLDCTVGPSSIVPRGVKLPKYGGQGAFRVPRGLAADEIVDIADLFAAAATRAVHAGFDGIEIHGANGYLIDQFLTDYTNRRTDRFGGPIAHRIRFAAMVLERVRAAVGPGFPVGIRLSQTKVNDPEHRWPGGCADACIVFTAARDAGADYLHIARGTRDADTTATIDGTTVTRLASEATQLPVIANGNLGDPIAANRVIATGDADLVSLGRSALANPDWPHRVRSGQPLAVNDHRTFPRRSAATSPTPNRPVGLAGLGVSGDTARPGQDHQPARNEGGSR